MLVICPFFFDKDIVTRISFLEVMENYDLVHLNKNNLIFQLDGAFDHFAYIVHDLT
jgi:hypothetical protein